MAHTWLSQYVLLAAQGATSPATLCHAEQHLFSQLALHATAMSAEEELRHLDLDRAKKATMVDLCRRLGLSPSGLRAQVETRLRAHRLRLAATASGPPPPPAGAAATVPQPPLQPPSSAVQPAAASPLAGPSATAAQQAPAAPLAGPSGPATNTGPLAAYPLLPQHAAVPTHTGPFAAVPPALPATLLLSAASSGPGLAAPASSLSLAGAPPPALPAAVSCPPAAVTPAGAPPLQPAQLAAIAQRAAQLAVAQALSSSTAAPPPQLPPSLQSAGLPPVPPASTTTAWAALQSPLPPSGAPIYQPPAASAGSLLSLQAQLPQTSPALAPGVTQTQPLAPLAAPAAAPASTFQMAPLNTSIPPIPSKFANAAATGEFVDFNELLYCIELGSGEEPPVQVHLADDQQLALSRKPRKRPISSFEEWVKCFSVYANTLCAYQPTRGPDMLGYLFVIASSLQEFSLPAVLAYDVAFRRKAALLKLSPWGQIDPLLYSRAFTGPGKAKANATCPLCLGIGHSAMACHLYSEGPARKSRGTAAGPRHAAPAREICINFNRGRCLRNDCPRRHVCSIRGCGGPHASLRCPDKRSSPRKTQ